MPLIDVAENFAARRLEALVELAKRHQTTLSELMQKLNTIPRRF